MSFYKVMLVDDEEEVRDAIRKKVNWEEIGFEVVATAENGEDAIEKAEQEPFDVVLTDIHMPFMDGLTMLRKIKEIIPGIKSVIFSGYDEFEYAKEAIRLEAEEYLLKPVDSEELKGVFLRIKERLDDEMSSKRNVEELRTYYQQSLPILKEQFMVGLLEGRLSPAKIKRFSAEYNIDIAAAFYSVAVLGISSPTEDKDALDMNLATVSLKKLVDEKIQDNIEAITINYLDTIVVVTKLKSTAMHKDFVAFMDRICKLSKRLLDVNTVAGVGRAYGNAEDIAVAFKEAKTAVTYRILLEENQAIYIEDIEPGEGVEEYIEEKQISKILHEVKVGTDDSLKRIIDECVARMKNETEAIGQLQFFYSEFLVELSRLARGHKLYQEAAELMETDVKTELAGFERTSDLAKRLFEQCMVVRDKIERGRLDNTRNITQKAIQYIADHYAQSDISVEHLCGYLNVSPTYFSSLFKKETGMSFVSYLTDVRMKQAQKLLDTTDEKSYVIAGMVGYEEPNYFSYVFKKQFGVSPSKYRQK